MSVIDDFMSKVIDLDEKEKEETILFLAEALINDNYEFLKVISPKVQDIVLPFLTNIAGEGVVKAKCILCGEKKECFKQMIYDKDEFKDVYICQKCIIKRYGRR